jgi:hypothetical protein
MIEKYRDGVVLTINGFQRWLIPFLASMITDWPEGQEVGNFKQGACAAQCNCRHCTRPGVQFTDTAASRPDEARTQKTTELERAVARGEIPPLTGGVRLTTAAARNAHLRKLSLNPEAPALSKAQLFAGDHGYVHTLPMDTMHTYPGGIGRLLRTTLKVVADHTEMDRRLKRIPVVRDVELRGLHYRAFPQGISTQQSFTCDDETAFMQQMAYVIGKSTRVVANEEMRAALVNGAVTAVRMLRINKLMEVHDGDLAELDAEAVRLGPAMDRVVKKLNAAVAAKSLNAKIKHADTPKVHSVVHNSECIRRYVCTAQIK